MSDAIRAAPAGHWWQSLLQFSRFSVVGGLATLSHVSTYVALGGVAGLPPVIANLLAFVLALALSYLGHGFWTFAGAARAPRGVHARVVRFVIVALLGLSMNTLFVVLIVDLFRGSYLYATPLMAGVTPLALFALNRRWVFS